MTNEYMKSVRLNEAAQRALLKNMETSKQQVESSKRAEERCLIHMLDVPLEVTHPDGAIAKFLICLRNISPGGVSFIHGGFLYPQSKVVLKVPNIWGDVEPLEGRVANCRHVEGQNHEIGVKFDKPCDRRRFLTLPGETPLDRDPDANVRSELAGRVLYLDPSPADAKLVAFHLKDSQVTIESITTCAEAVEKIKSSAIDLIMCSGDLEPEGDQPVEESLRSAGYKGPIVMVCNSADAEKMEQANDDDSKAQVLVKPYTPAKLIAALSSSLLGADPTGEGPIYSDLSNDPDAVELVEYYLGYVEEIAGALRKSIEDDKFDDVLVSCRTLMETGAGYGFTPITASAKVAVTELTASMSINDSISEIQRLLGVCERIEAKIAGTGTSASEEPDAPASAEAEAEQDNA